MNEAYMKIANSPVMWIACGIPLIWVIIQAIVYYQKSKKAALAMGITPIPVSYTHLDVYKRQEFIWSGKCTACV